MTDIPKGYKQTEVGVIPTDWEVESLERITDPKRTICYGIVQVGQFSNNGITVLAIKNLNGDYVTNIHRCSQAIERPYIRSRICPGDVLVSIKGTIGRIGIVPHHFSGNISRDLARISLTDSDVPEFWHQMLQSEMAQRRIDATTVGTTRLELSIGPLKKVAMPRPPKPEQRAIATALSDVDGLLGGLDRLINKKRDLKQAAMQQLLTGQTRLPGFHGEWEVKRLGDVFNISKGQLITEDHAIPGPIPVIAGGKKPAYFHNEPNRTGMTITVSASGASAGYVAFFDEPIFASDCSTISEGSDYSIVFVYFQLQLKQGNIFKLQTGGAQPHIHAVDLKPLEICLPPLPEQAAIAAVLSDMDAELAALEQRRDKTRDLKQAMMQELLTGRIRLA